MMGAVMRAAAACFLTCSVYLAAARAEGLKLKVTEGEGALNDIRSQRAKDPVVRVEDNEGHPVSGATVSFILPARGAGGTFANGELSLTVTTGPDGMAVARGLRPNRLAGPFQIRATASNRGETATATISQTNVAPAQGGGNGKKIGIIALIGGAAVGGIIAATHGGGSKSSSTPTAPTGTVVTAGAPTFGPP